MKRFLLTTAAAALIPAFAIAQQDSDSTTILPQDQAQQTDQTDQATNEESDSDSQNMVDSTSDESTSVEGEATADAEADTDAADADADATASADAADPAAEEEDATDTADAADPMAEVEDATDTADAADPMAEEEDATDTADAADPMAEESDTMEAAEGTDSMAGDADMSSEMASGEEGLGVTGDVSAKAIIGNRVYVIEGEWDKTASFNTVAEDWTRVGSVQDIVISDDGGIAGIVAEVGGFLGIGDKFVLLESGEAKLVPLEGGGYDVVTWYSNDQLTEMQAYETTQMQ